MFYSQIGWQVENMRYLLQLDSRGGRWKTCDIFYSQIPGVVGGKHAITSTVRFPGWQVENMRYLPYWYCCYQDMPLYKMRCTGIYVYSPCKHISFFTSHLKGVFAINERGYRLLSVASIRRKLLKTTNTEERSVHTNSKRCTIQLGS